jgi:hypothetical protein
MDKSQYWFLDLVVELQDNLKALTHPEIELLTNRKNHGLSFDEVAEIIYELCQQGDITTLINRQEVELSLTGIKAGLSGEANIYYGLTTQGGAKWEQYSNPNWDRYVDSSLGIDPYEGEIIATTRELAEKHLWYPDEDCLIHSGSEVWEVLSPWQATYWKTLPVGHRVRFEYEPIEETFWNEQIQRQREEYWALAKWYTNYLTGNPQS